MPWLTFEKARRINASLPLLFTRTIMINYLMPWTYATIQSNHWMDAATLNAFLASLIFARWFLASQNSSCQVWYLIHRSNCSDIKGFACLLKENVQAIPNSIISVEESYPEMICYIYRLIGLITSLFCFYK